MEIAKEKMGIDLNYKSNTKIHKKKKIGLFRNYRLITALVAFTLIFSFINIMLIINFFSLFVNL